MSAFERRLTEILDAPVDEGQTPVAEVFPLLYAELRRLAQCFMNDERREHTLQATALVNEAFIRLLSDQKANAAEGPDFFRHAARAMRHVLVDHARRKGRLRRGGHRLRVPLENVDVSTLCGHEDMLVLDEVLQQLDDIDPLHVRIVELRFFAGLTVEQTARVLDVSDRTIYREWRLIQAWLRVQMAETTDG